MPRQTFRITEFSVVAHIQPRDVINDFFHDPPKEQGNILTIHTDTKTKPLHGCLPLLLEPNLYSLTY